MLAPLLFAATFGYHVAEVDLKGDWLGQVPALLRECEMRPKRTRQVRGRAALEPYLQRDDVVIAYVDRGWTHIYDPSYLMPVYPGVWKRFSQRNRTRAILWIAEGTNDTAYFELLDKGKVIRHADNGGDDGKWRFVGKTLPQEHAGDWRESPAEGLVDVVGRLGAPFTLYERQGTCTVYEIAPPATKKGQIEALRALPRHSIAESA